MPHRRLFAATLGVALLAPAVAQDVRYELGLRVRAFESAFEAVCDEVTARGRVCEPLESAVQAFFGIRLDDVARQMDAARHALDPDHPPSDAVRWADALTLRVERRLLDRGAEAIAFRLLATYETELPCPEGAKLRLRLLDRTGEPLMPPMPFAIGELPMRGEFAVAVDRAGDHRLVIELCAGGEVLSRREQTVSFADGLATRLEALRPLAKLKNPRSTLAATARNLTRQLTGLARGGTRESDVAAVRHLAELEAIAAILAEQEPEVPAALREPGDYRLWLATPDDRVAARVLVPAMPADELVPVVVALHGAGGSENLFFDAYGAGKVVRLCRERGWFLVAPRSGLGGGSVSAAEVTAALAELYPIDTGRVFVVGHSMGAASAMRDASAAPGRYRAIALLGGGGRFRPGKAIAKLPIFLAPGERDFALGGARRLRDGLTANGAEALDYREYEATEHFGIVQVALGDVFAFFDRFAEAR